MSSLSTTTCASPSASPTPTATAAAEAAQRLVGALQALAPTVPPSAIHRHVHDAATALQAALAEGATLREVLDQLILATAPAAPEAPPAPAVGPAARPLARHVRLDGRGAGGHVPRARVRGAGLVLRLHRHRPGGRARAAHRGAARVGSRPAAAGSSAGRARRRDRDRRSADRGARGRGPGLAAAGRVRRVVGHEDPGPLDRTVPLEPRPDARAARGID
jgi:hypothetical protein